MSSHHVDVVADNVCVYDLGETGHGGHKVRFLKSLGGLYVRFSFNFIALTLQHTNHMTEHLVVP